MTAMCDAGIRIGREFSLEQGGAIFENADYDALSLVDVVDEEAGLIALAEKRPGRAVGGACRSISFIPNEDGMVTDMAEAANSWHEWPDVQILSKKERLHDHPRPPLAPKTAPAPLVPYRLQGLAEYRNGLIDLIEFL